MPDWIFLLTALSGGGAAVAAIASLMQVQGTIRTAEIDAYLRLMEDYGTDEMRHAIADLASFWRSSAGKYPDVGAAFLAERESNSENAQKLRGQCRLMTAFFGNAARLYDGGFISRRLFKLLISRPGLNIYYEVCEPINKARNIHGEDTQKYGSVLRRVVSKYGAGLY